MNKVIKVLLGVGYWLLSLTWGGIMTLIGLITAAVVILFFGGKPHRNGYSFIVTVGGNWGGISLGAVSFCGNYQGNYFEYIRRHEFGHSIQNIIMGPFFIFVVALPSLVRSWIYNAGKGKHKYDYIWFEYTASVWGTRCLNCIEDTTNYIYKFTREDLK